MKNKFILVLITFLLFLFSCEGVAAQEAGTFTDLKNLIDNTPTGKVILERDYVNNGYEGEIAITNDVTIDLNGHIINGRNIYRIFSVSNNAHLTIDDSNKTVIHKFDVDEWLLATLNEDTGTVEVTGGCITAGDVTSERTNKTRQNGKGSGIYLNSGSLTLNAGNIIGNKISDKFQFGAGIAAENNSKIIINGGMVSYNRTTWEGYGAGIYLNNSSLVINGGTISYNYGIYGGGINAYDNSTVIMNGGNISNNTGGHNGGGIALMVAENNIPLGYVSKATINGGVIENNTVVTPLVGVGGGISTNNGAELIINGGIIRKNNAMRGAGVGTWSGGNIKIYGGLITENISTEDTKTDDGTSGNHGAGVFFNPYFISGYGNVDAYLTIGKDAVITGNINDVTKKEDNLYFADGTSQKISIGTGEYAPSDKMNVGINMATPGVFTKDVLGDYGNSFTYDLGGYSAVKDGNVLKFVSDSENPTGKITLKENFFTSFLNTITFGLFFNEKVDVVITASDDTAVKSIEYFISNKKMILDEVKAITSWEKYSKITLEDDNEYVIYAKITDRSGKVTYISSDGFILDSIPVLIEGIENNKTYYATQKFNVSDKYLDVVKINDKETSDYTLEGSIDKTYSIEALDKAGNVTKLTITMKKPEELGDKIKDITVENVKKEDKPVIEEVKEIIENDTKDATKEEQEKLDVIEEKCDALLEKIEKNPNTLDNIIFAVVIGITSFTLIMSCGLYISKHN